MPIIAIHYIIFIGNKDGKMNFYLFIPLIAYGGAVAALTVALFIKTKRHSKGGNPPSARYRQGPTAVDTANRQGATGGREAPGVSVVVPFRNEERNLNALLASVDNQSYSGMIELIPVNDRSTDGGAEIIKKFMPNNPNLSINTIDMPPPADTETKLTSKQRALDTGVDRASYELILFTDADMILAPAWIASMVDSHLSTGAGLVFGHTSVTIHGLRRNDNKTAMTAFNTASRHPTFFRRLFMLFEAYQLEYLFSFARAFSKLNLMGSCMGNNVLVTKAGYTACGGQRGIGYTIVEDRALMGIMRKKGIKTVAQEPFTVTAWTYPSRSTGQFVNQMLRWAAGGLRPGNGLFAAGLLLLAQNAMFLLSIMGVMPPLQALLSATNFLLTWAFLSISFHRNGSPVSTILFPAYYIFMMIETAVFVPLMLFKRRIDWKGRKV
jgi:cellulose synthase/poly-beta-1,6-N-acetylglucosamine synthase-like glycosyltransferase